MSREEDDGGHPDIADRELSWLAFNGRVLQEAADPDVPLFERLNFLAIFSSNLDEFFRVRVASLRSLLRLKKKRVKRLSLDPRRLLREIHRVVHRQQEEFGHLFRDLLPRLEDAGIRLRSESQLTSSEREALRARMAAEVLPALSPVPLVEGTDPPFLADRSIHLVVELWSRGRAVLPPPEYALVAVHSPPLPRFWTLPAEAKGVRTVVFLDDALRVALPDLFPDRDVGGAWAVKLSRDAELHLEDEFEGDVVAAIRKSLSKRETGVPARFLYDMRTPWAVVRLLHETLGLEDDDMVVGGRYHNLHDLRSFPRDGAEGHVYPPAPPLPHPDLEGVPSVLEAVEERDRLLHFPYHSYDHVVRFLTEAAEDPHVEEIWLTVYRVGRRSRVLAALLEARERGKMVHVFVEVKARFDEASNVEWADRLRDAGVTTSFSDAELKVHAKIALVVRRTPEGGRRRYAYLGTGNFNEDTARFYTDFALLTADHRIAGEVEQVFHMLVGRDGVPRFEHLLVAPHSLRDALVERIRREADRSRSGRSAGITLKLNALEDEAMIRELHEAARAGVPIRGIVRGICRMVPPPGDGVQLRSVVDRWLEHGRVYVFHGTDGPPDVYLASADWMHRNLSRRVEVAFPILEPSLRDQVLDVLELQIADDRKGRILDGSGRNVYAGASGSGSGSQAAVREYLARLVPPPAS
ncbi:MAG: polyphosphate kinase 1 [Longimicrobiales bacterium]